jgi:hypothetical protein
MLGKFCVFCNIASVLSWTVKQPLLTGQLIRMKHIIFNAHSDDHVDGVRLRL